MKKTRLTVDMSPEEHMFLKMGCAKLGITMREFLIASAFEKLQEIEDEWLSEQAKEALEKIHSGKDQLISWDEMKKRIDQ